PLQRAVPRIDCVNLLRSALQKAIDKPADIRSQISADQSRHIDAELHQRMFQLLACSGNKALFSHISILAENSSQRRRDAETQRIQFIFRLPLRLCVSAPPRWINFPLHSYVAACPADWPETSPGILCKFCTRIA